MGFEARELCFGENEDYSWLYGLRNDPRLSSSAERQTKRQNPNRRLFIGLDYLIACLAS